MHHADRVSVCDADWSKEIARLVDPMRACHLAIAVEIKVPGPDGTRVAAFSTWQDGGDTGANGAFAHFKRSLAFDQRGKSQPRHRGMSVIAFSGPGVPSNGMPMSRARGLVMSYSIRLMRRYRPIVAMITLFERPGCCVPFIGSFRDRPHISTLRSGRFFCAPVHFGQLPRVVTKPKNSERG